MLSVLKMYDIYTSRYDLCFSMCAGSLYASDGLTQSSVQELSVLVCSGCSGHGTCVFDNTDRHEVTCACDVGYQGETSLIIVELTY